MAEIHKTVRTSLGGKAGVVRVEATRWVASGTQRIRQDGLWATLRAGASLAAAHATFPVTASRLGGRTFRFANEDLRYDASRWNNSWLNERVVEVAVARALLSARRGKMLEIGNVLSHYGWSEHTILDLYEGIPGVINDDVRTWRSEERFDTIASISTLEHVGWDGPAKDPSGPVVAAENLRRHLAPGGLLLVTVPLGYNPHLDNAVATGELKFDEMIFLERTSRRNDWVCCDKDAALERSYGTPFRNANALLVGIDRR